MQRDVWVFLFVLGLMLFGWPALSIFRFSLIGYLFFIWAVFIALIYITTVLPEREDKGG